MTILGTETEYGIWAAGLSEGQQADPIGLSEAVVQAVEAPGTRWDYADEHPLVDARGSVVPRSVAHPDLLTDEVRQANRLLGNGGRSYVDHAHPEWSGPEVTSAHEAVVHDLAGDRIHWRAAQRASRETGLDIRLVKNTTDNKGRSYGSHENHLLPRDLPFDRLVEQLPSFLASRVVVQGAGRVGLGTRGEQPGFQLSQRADFIERVVGLETTLRRALVNTRDEPHADPRRHRRLHLISGDASLCQVAALVRHGSMALVLRAIASGVELPRLADPVAAMKAFSRDPSCTLRQPCSDGVDRSAVELQRAWWTACQDESQAWLRWGELLDDLAVDPLRCADRIDWVAKLRLLDGLRRRHDLDWGDPRLDAADLRYGELGEGLFARLEASGAVARIVAEDEVTRAMHQPPVDTRAWLRGTLLARFGESVVQASWDQLVLVDGARRHHALRLVSPLDGTRKQWGERLASVHDVDELCQLLGRLGWTTEEAS